MALNGYLLHFQALFVFVLSLSALAEITVTKCFKGTHKEPQGQAALSCPAGSVISITEALLGKNKWFECVLTEDDCMHSTKIFRDCEGLNSCERIFKTFSARCGYSTILLISYDCIQVALPTTPVNTTTSNSGTGVEGGVSEGIDQDGDASGNENQMNRNPYNEKRPKEEDESEVGLLVATICASLVTGVMLIIAIVMTIRRILNYPAWLQNRNRENSSRWDACMERACFQVDKFPCFSGQESPEGSPEQALRSQNKSTCAAIISAEDPVPNIQPTRMTPIGQESSDSDVIAQPTNISNRDEDPEGSDTSEHAQTLDTTGIGVTRSFRRNRQTHASDYSVPRNGEVEHYDNSIDRSAHKYGCTKIKNVEKTSIYNSVKYSSRNNEKCVIEIEKQIEQGQIQTSEMCSYNHNNNNDVWKDQYAETPLDNDVQGVNNNSIYNNNNNNNNNKETDYTTIKSEYSAIVVPNTETSSKC